MIKQPLQLVTDKVYNVAIHRIVPRRAAESFFSDKD
jgi:hypothetical protein